MSEEKDYPSKGWTITSRLPRYILFGGARPRKAVLAAFDELNPWEQKTVDLTVFFIFRQTCKLNPRLTQFQRSYPLNTAMQWILAHQEAQPKDLHEDSMRRFIDIRYPRWETQLPR